MTENISGLPVASAGASGSNRKGGLDGAEDSTGIWKHAVIILAKLYALKQCSSFLVSYNSIKLLFKKEEIKVWRNLRHRASKEGLDSEKKQALFL